MKEISYISLLWKRKRLEMEPRAVCETNVSWVQLSIGVANGRAVS